MLERVVVDTNMFIAAVKGTGGASRNVLRLCLNSRCRPLMGDNLFNEYCDVLGRAHLFTSSPLSPRERGELLDAFLSVCEWTPVYFLWRPNLPDEGDNHLIELAVAGSASAIITHNLRDLRRGELQFPAVEIQTPAEFLKRRSEHHGNDDDSDS